MPNLLVVDDEQSICWGLTQLGEELGHRVWTASSAERALELIEEHKPDVIVLDVRLPGMSGLEAIEQFRRSCQDTPVIVITAYGDLATAVSALRSGAFEYITKPFDLAKVQQALTRALASQAEQPRSAVSERLPGLIGHSAAMQEVFTRIALASATEISVLLSGESGTGKELAARAIHQYSPRANGPFVAVNVAALSSSLAESELFGHVQGAFTGADRDRPGLLVQANGGTLFLDEVADIPLPTQVKLLRALEHQEVLPIGAGRPVTSNFRVISATHQDLLARVRAGAFRHDLYFRLCAFEIPIPALRDRPDDIEELAEHFLALANRATEHPTTISAEARRELIRRPWYGNVRELRNAIEHAAMLARRGCIEPDHLPRPSTPFAIGGPEQQTMEESLSTLVLEWIQRKLASNSDVENLYDELLKVVERPLLQEILKRHEGQCAAAARTLGLHRTTVRKKAEQYGLLDE